MSRTFREIPNWSRTGTKVVRDKDNHGCMYSKPSEFTDQLNADMRALTKQRLRMLTQSGTQPSGAEIAREDAIDMDPLPHPTEYKEYWW